MKLSRLGSSERTLFGGVAFRRGSAPNLALLFTLDVCGRSVALLAMCFDCLVHRTFFGPLSTHLSHLKSLFLTLHINLVLYSHFRQFVLFDLDILIITHHTLWPNHSLL